MGTCLSRENSVFLSGKTLLFYRVFLEGCGFCRKCTVQGCFMSEEIYFCHFMRRFRCLIPDNKSIHMADFTLEVLFALAHLILSHLSFITERCHVSWTLNIQIKHLKQCAHRSHFDCVVQGLQVFLKEALFEAFSLGWTIIFYFNLYSRALPQKCQAVSLDQGLKAFNQTRLSATSGWCSLFLHNQCFVKVDMSHYFHTDCWEINLMLHIRVVCV